MAVIKLKDIADALDESMDRKVHGQRVRMSFLAKTSG